MYLNKYKKTQIILLILIAIASVVFIISVIKSKNVKSYQVAEAVSDVTAMMDENIDDKLIDEEDNEIENEEDTSWDEDAEDTETNIEEEKDKKVTYYLKVNYTANVVTAYTKDSAGEYTVPVKAMVCSTGTATPTSGVYKMSNKYRWHQLNGGVYGQYCSRITGHILFHSVPYKTNSPDSLKYAAYDKLGTKASAGCIRLTVADALWIYNNCASGTYVEFYSSSNPGPLGKPSAQKISSNVSCRDWDPTDPLSQNPWHSYVAPASTTPEKTIENNNKYTEQNNNSENNYQSNNNNQNNNNNNNNNNNTNQDKDNSNKNDTPNQDESKENNNTSNETTENSTKENTTPENNIMTIF